MSLISRREFLAGLPAIQTRPASGKGQQYPSEIKRYPDPLTDREAWRLTGLLNLHHLPDCYQRFVAHNNSFLLLGGERGGERQIFRMELPSGRMVQLSEGSGVGTYSICLAPDERSFFFLQNGTLKQMGFRKLQEREIYQVEDGWWATGDMGVSVDGRYAALVEMKTADRIMEAGGEERFRLQFERKPLCRIRVVETAQGKNWVAAEERAWLGRPQLRPKRDQVLYCHEGPWERVASRMWLVNLDGKQKQSLRPRQGEEELGHEYWTGDGKLIGYVNYPDHSGRKATVRTLNPDTREEQVLAPCTQFWHLMGNPDNSAIVGESRSKAGPNIYVLFPLTQRELTVCEHASSRKPYPAGAGPEDLEAVQPRPAFSPDSQLIYFTSDREGMPAVYRTGVADLVEKT